MATTGSSVPPCCETAGNVLLGLSSNEVKETEKEYASQEASDNGINENSSSSQSSKTGSTASKSETPASKSTDSSKTESSKNTNSLSSYKTPSLQPSLTAQPSLLENSFNRFKESPFPTTSRRAEGAHPSTQPPAKSEIPHSMSESARKYLGANNAQKSPFESANSESRFRENSIGFRMEMKSLIGKGSSPKSASSSLKSQENARPASTQASSQASSQTGPNLSKPASTTNPNSSKNVSNSNVLTGRDGPSRPGEALPAKSQPSIPPRSERSSSNPRAASPILNSPSQQPMPSAKTLVKTPQPFLPATANQKLPAVTAQGVAPHDASQGTGILNGNKKGIVSAQSQQPSNPAMGKPMPTPSQELTSHVIREQMGLFWSKIRKNFRRKNKGDATDVPEDESSENLSAQAKEVSWEIERSSMLSENSLTEQKSSVPLSDLVSATSEKSPSALRSPQ